jgi:DNA topoisomerase-1
MATAKGETRRILIQATGDPCEFLWQSSYKRTTFPGWKRLGQVAKLDEEEEQAESEQAVWKQVEAVKEGQAVQWTSMEANPYQTKAPPRYTEATLVRELEKRGIGRPSTFAMLISTIQDKDYVKKEDKPAQKVQRKKYAIQPNQWPPISTSYEQAMGGEKDKLVPTPLGERVLKFCLDKFNDLFEYGFTAQMETRLDKIAEGGEPWKQVLRDTWASYKQRYETLKSAETERKDGTHQYEGGIKAVQAKKGPLLLIESPDGDKDKTVFLGWPEGVKWEDMTPEKAAEFATARKQELAADILGTFDGKPIERKKGPFGTYVVWGTTKLSIKGTETLEEIEKALREKGNDVLHTLGPFEFRKGPYGLYMFKKDMKQKKFVGLPEGLDPKKLTQEEAVKLYQNGLQQKARTTQFKNHPQQGTSAAGRGRGGGGGGFRGRGRGRGRGK